MPLIENIKFCKIATRIQDFLAQAPLLRNDDLVSLDSQLVAWYDNLPWVLRSTEPCPESLYTARCVMKWRYQNLRIVLLRPVLLNLANRGKQSLPREEELIAVQKCRSIARQTIEDIAHEWTPNQMLGWNAVWFLYQASMIPLVSIFWEPWNTAQASDCQTQIEVVLEAFEGMTDWSLAARRSREVLLKMYEATKQPIAQQQPSPVSSGGGGGGGMMHADQMSQMEMMEQDGLLMLDHDGVWDLDGMLWANLPDSLDMPYEGRSNMEFEDQGMLGYDERYMMGPA